MHLFGHNGDEEIENSEKSYIWTASSIIMLLMYTLCPKCKKSKLEIKYKSTGISTKADISCISCGVIQLIDMDYKTQKGESNELNVKAVMGTMCGGSGYTFLKSILYHLNIPCMVTNTYTSIAKKVAAKSIDVCIFAKYYLAYTLIYEINSYEYLYLLDIICTGYK